MYHHQFCSLVALAAMSVLQVAEAFPLRGSIVVQRDNVDHVVVYQEVLEVVAATSTVYVNPPAEATSLPLSKAADAVLPTPTPQAADAVLPTPSPQAAKAAVTAATSTGSGSASGAGTATFYTPGMGSCGIESSDSEHVVALSHLVMEAQGAANPNANPLCGKKVEVKHIKSGKTVRATVVDTCPGCAKDDIDLSPSCFEKIAQLADGRVAVSWSMV